MARHGSVARRRRQRRACLHLEVWRGPCKKHARAHPTHEAAGWCVLGSSESRTLLASAQKKRRLRVTLGLPSLPPPLSSSPLSLLCHFLCFQRLHGIQFHFELLLSKFNASSTSPSPSSSSASGSEGFPTTVLAPDGDRPL